MARPEKKYNFIYKTTNLKNGKYYVGMHSTNDLNDGYLGSGTRLRRSIRKHGIENFKLEILEFLPDRNSLKIREAELVNEELLEDSLNINLVYGGHGGYISPDGYKKGAKKMLDIIWKDAEFRKRKSEWKSKQNKTLWETGKLKYKDNWTGKTHSEETKKKIGEANKIKQSGSANSQFGTCWITNGTENKKIKKTDFHLYKEWKLGRV